MAPEKRREGVQGEARPVPPSSPQVWRQGKGDFFLGCLLMAEVSTPFVCLGKILIQVRGACGCESLSGGHFQGAPGVLQGTRSGRGGRLGAGEAGSGEAGGAGAPPAPDRPAHLPAHRSTSNSTLCCTR